MSEIEAPASLWGKALALLTAAWLALPEKQKERAVDSVIKGFESVFGHFWDLFKKKSEANPAATDDAETVSGAGAEEGVSS